MVESCRRGCRDSSDVTGTSVEGAGPLESMSVATPGAATSTTSVTSRRRRRSLPPTSRDGEISRPGGSSAAYTPRLLHAKFDLHLSLFSSILEILFYPRHIIALPCYRPGFPRLVVIFVGILRDGTIVGGWNGIYRIRNYRRSIGFCLFVRLKERKSLQRGIDLDRD